MTRKELDDAIYDFIAAYAFTEPDSPPCEIFKGYQDLVNLPDDPNYAVFTCIGDEEVEIGMEGFSYDPDSLGDGWIEVANLRQYTFQIASVGPHSKRRLNRLVTVFNASPGALFFRRLTSSDKYGGVGPVRAGDVIDLTRTDGTRSYALTYSADFVVAARLHEHIAQDWANRIDPKTRLVAIK
jgi:hypothetical protein